MNLPASLCFAFCLLTTPCFFFFFFFYASVREEDLVLTLKMTPRDIHRICGKLKEDRLIKM
jgi:hypothetical protein